MPIKLLILLKSVDGGTGTYLEGLLKLKDIYPSKKLDIKVLVLEKPKYRDVATKEYFYYSQKGHNNDNYNLSIKSIGRICREIRWFKENINSFTPSVVLSSNPHSIFIAECVKLLYGFKYKTISLIQNNLDKVIEYKLKKWMRLPANYLFGTIARRSDKVVTVSRYLSRYLHDVYRLEEIPVTIPALMLRNCYKENTTTKPAKQILISVARLDLQKDHETLLKAFQTVRAKIVDLELWIVGDGPQKNKLIKLVKDLGIEDSVVFFGWVQNPVELLDKSSIFILSTKWEGYGLGILEAMARGIPVIASDCKYGPAEILGKNKFGLLVPVGDSEALSNAISLLLKDKKKLTKYSHMAKKRSLDYKLERMLPIYKTIIDSLIDIK